MQLSTAVRNARLDAIESTVGEAPTLEVRTGVAPANCAASATGTLLASITLPTDWMGNASGGTKSHSGSWEDPSANATGTAGYFRIIKDGTCHVQGTCSGTGGSGDLRLSDTALTAAQQFRITSFTITDGNA